MNAHPRYQTPCGHYSRENGAECGAVPTRQYMTGHRCRSHTPAALAGRPEPKPDPAKALKARGVPPLSASRLVDDRAVASGKRRSSPSRYAEARAAEAHRRAREQARRTSA